MDSLRKILEEDYVGRVHLLNVVVSSKKIMTVKHKRGVNFRNIDSTKTMTNVEGESHAGIQKERFNEENYEGETKSCAKFRNKADSMKTKTMLKSRGR
jgi:hypothetical protein